MELLLEQGARAECRIQDNGGKSCSLLFYVILAADCTSVKVQILELLAIHGADIESKDNYYAFSTISGSPLDVAKHNGDQQLIDCVQALIEKKRKR